MVKKLSVLLAALMLFTLCACSCDNYVFTPVTMPASGPVVGDGGNMLIIGKHLYFVNGIAAQTDINDYGTPEIGALMRVKLEDIDKLENEDLEENIYEMVIPKIIYNTSAKSTGLFVHENRIYFISPSIKRDNTNAIEYTRHDIMSAKFDGSDIKTHFTTEAIASEVYFTLMGNKVYFNYLLSGSVYYVEVNANKPERVEISDNAGALFVGDNKLFYTHTVLFKDANGNDMNQPYNEIRTVNPDGTGDKVICDGRAVIGGTPSDDYQINCIHGKTFTIVSMIDGKLLYTVATASSSAMGPDGSYYYDHTTNIHSKLSWNNLSGILPYDEKNSAGTVIGKGFLYFDAGYIKYGKINDNGIPTYTELLYASGITLDRIVGDTLYFKVSSVIHSVSISEMFKRAENGKILTKGTKLHTTAVNASVTKYINFENAFFFIGSSGYPCRATIKEAEEIVEYVIQYIPEED